MKCDEHLETAVRRMALWTRKPSSNLAPTVTVNAVLCHNARIGNWEGGPRLPCVGEVSMAANGESGHEAVKTMNFTLLVCFGSGFCLLDHANVTKVHRPVDVELRHDGQCRAIP